MLPTGMVRALIESLKEQREFEMPWREPVLVDTHLTAAAEEALGAGAKLGRSLTAAGSSTEPCSVLVVRFEIR